MATTKTLRPRGTAVVEYEHEGIRGVLLPIYLETAPLPTYMKMVQYIDCREGFGVSLAQAAAQIVKKL